jgi:hypothetical protein
LSDDQKPGNLPAVRTEETDGLAVRIRSPFDADFQVFSTFPADWKNRTELENSAMDGDSIEGKLMINKEFVICHFVMSLEDITDSATGELIPAWKTVLIGPNAEKYRFVAMSIIKGLKLLARVHGQPGWEPGIRVVLLQGKNNWYKFKDLGRDVKVEALGPAQ